ncbi:MAG: TonB-dependent receptor plug domain-containing protein, partial [Psychrobacter sp.]
MSVSRASSRTYLRLSILSALGLLAVNTAMAATSENASINDSNLPQVELDEIVVTATRTPTKTSNVIAQTRVINKEELQRYQGQTVLDVLKRQPGIAFKQNGGLGASSNFYMRGYDSKQVLVLIDGIRYSSVSAGGAALNLLPADQIDRIEVLYGASGSSIYGADAMGGVIQVFTKGSNIDRSSMSVTAGIGSNDHYVYGASAQLANTNGTTLSLSASHNETDGINATRPDPSNQNDPYNKDADGFESDSVSLAVNQRFGDTLLTGASILYSKSTTEYDDGIFEDVHADQENGAAQAYVDWQYMPDASVKLQYGHSVDKSESYAKYPNVFDGTQDQISLVGKNKLLAGEAVYGLEYLTQDLDSTAYSIDDRNVKSAFAGYVVA